MSSSVPTSKPARKSLRASLAALICATVCFISAACGTPTNQAQGNGILGSDRVSVHDPSILKADGKYYVYGSHRAYAKSKDLVHWETFENNLSTKFKEVLGKAYSSWPQQEATPDVGGNMWAPDVMYNKAMKKYCMYLSLNGDQKKSVIVLLTSDSPEGNWTYVGPVVYSGFGEDSYKKMDLEKVIGSPEQTQHYLNQTIVSINAIDPTVKYDEEGNLWMSYGSWFGGIFMLKLDPTTGLRDYTHTYETVDGKSDAYFGIQIAGGLGNSGEGSYLIRNKGYWYLFLSYGGLQQRGGYQIREFRSKEITGPYVDEAGNPALAEMADGVNWTSETGIRLLSSYQWSGSSKKHFEVAQGHNSVLNDNGKFYLVYHTRFADTAEMHQIRVHELLPTQSDWLTAAPYEFTGTKSKARGYKKEKVVGKYELITHVPTTFFNGTFKNMQKKIYRGVNLPQKIELTSDGSISGDITGKWSLTPGTNFITLSIGGTTYSGALDELPNETSGAPVMTFSAIGKNVSIWGSQVSS